jgi:hypothetical protein
MFFPAAAAGWCTAKELAKNCQVGREILDVCFGRPICPSFDDGGEGRGNLQSPCGLVRPICRPDKLRVGPFLLAIVVRPDIGVPLAAGR